MVGTGRAKMMGVDHDHLAHGNLSTDKTAPPPPPPSHSSLVSPSSPPTVHLSLREQYVERFYTAAGVQLFNSLDYTILTPSPDDSLLVSDETRDIARMLFGDQFDLFVRQFAVKYWFISLLLQLICMSFGVYLLTASPSYHYLNFFCLPGTIFPTLLLLRSHYKIFLYMCQEWEPMFLASYAVIFCICNLLLVRNPYSFLFIIFVLLPTLLSCIFGDASALRLDYAFIKGDISIAALALPPCLVSLGGIAAILITNLDGYNGVDLGDYNIMGYARAWVWTSGFTLCVFIGRSIVHIIKFPHKCVSIQTPLIISTVTLNSNERFSSIQDNQQMTCSLLLTGKFDYVNGEISMSGTTTGNPLTSVARPSCESPQRDLEIGGV